MLTTAGKIALGIALTSLCGQAVAAQDSISTKLVAQQIWTMSAPRGQMPPDCVETWTFNAEGGLNIKSGAEIVTKQWRVKDDDSQVSLYMRRISSTGGLDCLGTANAASDEPEADEGGPLWLLAFNSGDALILCNPQYVIDEKTKKQTPMYGDDACWGELKPAK